MARLKELIRQRKFWIFILLEAISGSIFLYLFWFDIISGTSEQTPPVIFFLTGVFGLLANGLPPLFYSKEMAEMYNQASWGLYKITPQGAKKIGIFFVSICIIWFGYLVYDNQGIVNLWRIVLATLRQ